MVSFQKQYTATLHVSGKSVSWDGTQIFRIFEVQNILRNFQELTNPENKDLLLEELNIIIWH